jgi:hypothetical protein
LAPTPFVDWIVDKRAVGRILSEGVAHFQDSSSQIYSAAATTDETSREATAVAGLRRIEQDHELPWLAGRAGRQPWSSGAVAGRGFFVIRHGLAFLESRKTPPFVVSGVWLVGGASVGRSVLSATASDAGFSTLWNGASRGAWFAATERSTSVLWEHPREAGVLPVACRCGRFPSPGRGLGWGGCSQPMNPSPACGARATALRTVAAGDRARLLPSLRGRGNLCGSGRAERALSGF